MFSFACPPFAGEPNKKNSRKKYKSPSCLHFINIGCNEYTCFCNFIIIPQCTIKSNLYFFNRRFRSSDSRFPKEAVPQGAGCRSIRNDPETRFALKGRFFIFTTIPVLIFKSLLFCYIKIYIDLNAITVTPSCFSRRCTTQ